MDSIARLRRDFSQELGPSGVFLLPSRDDANALRNVRPKTNRLAVWIAIGLGLMSALGGIVYYMHYHRVGNRVTEILPRDTVAYVYAGQPLALEESVLSLNRWASSRPIRNQLTLRQQLFVRAKLLDMGLSSSALVDLKEGAREIHLAVLADSSRAPTVSPYSTLIFLAFDNNDVRDQLIARIEPFFDHVGPESGVDIAVRRTAEGIVGLASFEEYVVLSLGGDAPIRQVLRNRKRGPNHSLNDDISFRDAYRARERQSYFWSYARYDHALSYGLSRWVYPYLTASQQQELNVHRHLFSPDLLAGLSFNARVTHGDEQAMIRLYPSPEADLTATARLMGEQKKRTLTAIPSDAVFAAALTVQEPNTLINTRSEPLLRAIKDLQFTDLANTLDTLVQHIEQSSIQVQTDIWDNLANEVALAWIPTPNQETPQPLVVIPVQETGKAHQTTLLLAKQVLRPLPFFAGASPTIVDTKSGGHIRMGPQAPQADAALPSDDSHVLLCWRTHQGFWIAGRQCGVVERAVQTIEEGNGLSSLAPINDSLTEEQTTNTGFIALRPTALMRWLAPQQASFVRDDFWATASIHVTQDYISIASNISPVSIATHQAMQKETHTNSEHASNDHADPCKQLVSAVCDSLHDNSHCPEWTEKVRGTPTTACEAGLRTLQALDRHPL